MDGPNLSRCLARRDSGIQLLYQPRRIQGRCSGVSPPSYRDETIANPTFVSTHSSQTMKDSLMYKMSYYRYANLTWHYECILTNNVFAYRFPELFGGGQAVDRVRNQVIPNTPIQLDTIGKSISHPCRISVAHRFVSMLLEEAFTSENWIVSTDWNPVSHSMLTFPPVPFKGPNLPSQEGRRLGPRTPGCVCL